MRKVKRILSAALTAALLFTMAACGNGTPVTAYSPAQMADIVLETQSGMPEMTRLTPDDLGFSSYIENQYQISAPWDDGVIVYPAGAYANEIAVILLQDEGDIDDVKESLLDYIESRAAAFTGYMPEQAEMLSQARVFYCGKYVALLVCGDAVLAENSLTNCFESGAEKQITPAREVTYEGEGYVPFDPPNEADMTICDTSEILSAWRTGDGGGLSEKDAAVLTACREVLSDLISDDMNEYDKELAVHDWMTGRIDYDYEVITGEAGADSSNPYGALINRKAICLGYAVTFQLFMDMLDIECITVVGASYSSSEDHAWNMVRLDGDWYCVDVTWDASVFRHKFFNVTSQEMRDSDHQWDYDAVPEATATAYRHS